MKPGNEGGHLHLSINLTCTHPAKAAFRCVQKGFCKQSLADNDGLHVLKILPFRFFSVESLHAPPPRSYSWINSERLLHELTFIPHGFSIRGNGHIHYPSCAFYNPSFVSRPCGTKNNHNPSFVPDCISSSYSCMELHDIVLYYNYILIVTNFSDTKVVILCDWSDTGRVKIWKTGCWMLNRRLFL